MYEPCPIGTYQREPWQSFCNSCAPSYLTERTGSTNVSDCKFSCPAGQEKKPNEDSCIQCVIGYFRDGMTPFSQCEACPGQFTTLTVGSVSVQNCTLCKKYCAIGYFKDNNEDVFGNCTRCRNASYVTSTVGSISNANCTVLNCEEGYKANLTTQTCVPCPRGTYQDKKYQTDCLACPTDQYTRQTNSTRPGDCETYCNSGYEKNVNSCNPCQRGYYKDNMVDLFMACTACDSTYVTPAGPPATNASQCTIRNCPAGSFINGDNCTLCPKGSFQDQPWQTNCTVCGPNRNTEKEGATNNTMCLLSCPAGTENKGLSDTCDPCMVGYYKDVEAAARCRPCGNFSENDIHITTTNGSTSINNCTKLVCLAGHYPANNKCTPCEFGTFQPVRWADSCSICNLSYTTYIRGAVSSSDCEYNCSLGEELVNGTCVKCAVGFYNNKTDPTRRQCFPCPSGLITQQEGATSVLQCNIVDCLTLGQYRDVGDNTCKDCPIGQFQDTIRQTKCKGCPFNTTTQSVKSTSVADCKKDCESGFFLNSTDNTCMACPEGTYRNKTEGHWNCSGCGANLTTAKSGSTKLSDCSVR
ncbi:unnamed protein product, partial [Candidula unifasciata]